MPSHGTIHPVNKLRGLVFVVLAAFLAGSQGSANRQGGTGSSSWQIKKIAVEVGAIPHIAIFVIEPPSSKAKLLVEGEAPTWSPDGKRIAYCARLGAQRFGQIEIMNADGSGRTKLTNVKGGACSPEWAPDGERLAFTALGGKIPMISIIDKSGENVKAIVEGSSAKWSPDGRRLLFYRGAERRGTRGSFWIANADGTEAKQVIVDNSETMEATWFPDGKSIAFTSERKHNSSIFRCDLDGSNIESIAADKKYSLYFPVFSPDGQQLIVDAISNSGDGISIMQVDLASHEAKTLGSGRHPSIVWEKK